MMSIAGADIFLAMKKGQRVYTVNKAAGNILPEAPWDADAWKNAEVAQIDCFPWYKSGKKQKTVVRALYDSSVLHVLFESEDTHISAKRRKYNGDVYLDSCVEFFLSPWPSKTNDYFNIESNCCAVLHIGLGPDRRHRKLIPAKLARQITLVSTVPGKQKTESSDDNGWKLYMRIPRSALSALAGKRVRFAGTWKGNFYRCGGKTNDQYAVWSPIGVPEPDYHRPEYFGDLVFE